MTLGLTLVLQFVGSMAWANQVPKGCFERLLVLPALGGRTRWTLSDGDRKPWDSAEEERADLWCVHSAACRRVHTTAIRTAFYSVENAVSNVEVARKVIFMKMSNDWFVVVVVVAKTHQVSCPRMRK